MESTQHTRARQTIPALTIWLALFCVLNITDLVSTYVALGTGLREGNPLMSALLGHYGFGALIVYKLLVIGVVVFGVLALNRYHPRLARLTILICNALVFVAVSLNILQLRMM